MQRWLFLLWSTVAQKILMALTGLALIGFVVVHLLGNFALLQGGDAFNSYAHFLESFGGLLIVSELGLIALFALHVITALTVTLANRKARGKPYILSDNAGGASRKTLSSRTMIVTGVVLFLFIVIHVWMFKYGPGEAQGYRTEINGVEMRDLHRLVVESFKNGWISAGYVAVMVFLGFHLRHAFWSAFQSLGIHHPKATPLIYGAGGVLAVALAAGFLMLPIWIYFAGGGV